MQILANQAPIGFEAEFVNQRGQTIMYRGILLPFSSDDDTIDFIYGVINWKELADQQTTDELLLEVNQVLEQEAITPPLRSDEPMTDWADGPVNIKPALHLGGISDLGAFKDSADPADSIMPMPAFGTSKRNGPAKQPVNLDEPYELAIEAEQKADDIADQNTAAVELPELDEAEMELCDWLASARELAQAANSSEDRTRNALYEAVGRAYDFSLAADQAPEEFDELVTDSGLTTQERAPMTPIVKLVFGAEYDKTRLTEYAAALSHGHRLGLKQGGLSSFLKSADGGLKGVVKAERRLRREESGKPVEAVDAPRERLAKKLRKIEPQSFDMIAPEGQEFSLVMIRRLPTGEVIMLGEVPEDVALVERAARKLLG